MISVTLTKNPKVRPPQDELGFGKYFTDHMFLCDHTPDKGWHDARIVPYGDLSLDPAAMVFHYGQEIFEGLKAYLGVDGKVRLFRAIENVRRLNRSLSRVGMPQLDEAFVMDAITELVRTDKSWIPTAPDTSLYIRPFVIATDPFVGVRASDNYTFVIILSPVGAYYKGGMTPTKIFVENSDVRAVRGGLGEVKAGANYAATIRAQENAKLEGFSQVLWLDALERRYVEEIGTSNAFFVIDGKVVTPPLGGSILPGITRWSCLKLLDLWGVEVQERQIAIDEVIETAGDKRLTEAFASGTAAVISPVGSMHYKGMDIEIGGGKIGALSQKLYDTLTGIQWGKTDDPFGWVTVI